MVLVVSAMLASFQLLALAQGEWLGQDLPSARLHGLHRNRRITVSREEDWHVGPSDGDAFLQVETVKAWKGNVKYQAARNKHS